MFFYIFVGQALMFDNFVLRLVTNALILGAMGALLYMDGMKTGEEDVAYAEIAYSRQQDGQDIPKQERDRCFHPLKGLFSVLVGMLPLVLIALALALTAQVQRYHLGGLPSWLESYRTRQDIGIALAYYNETIPMGVTDVLRIIVRPAVPVCKYRGQRSSMHLLWLERFSPCWCCWCPWLCRRLCAGAQGPCCCAWQHRADHKRRVRRDRRERKRRRTKEPTQLV